MVSDNSHCMKCELSFLKCPILGIGQFSLGNWLQSAAKVVTLMKLLVGT